MNEQERQEIAAIRAELDRLRRQQSIATHSFDVLSDRLNTLERRAREAETFERLKASSPPVEPVKTDAKPPILPSPPVARPAPPVETPKAEPAGSRVPPVPPSSPAEEPAPREPESPPPPKVPWEIRLGTYWLPRIGIVMVLTALVFLAYYIHGRLPLWVKVIAMYAFCGVGIGLGAWVEKRYEILGRSLFAGGLAGTYFVTYALHYVEPLRMIDSAVLCGTLLLCIVAVIVGLAQWRNRPLLAGMAILLGFYTSAISDVSSFTLVSNCLLAAGALYLMLVSGWAPLTGVAFIGTYGTYVIWLLRSGEQTTVHFKMWFVLIYWGLFTLSVFAARQDLVQTTVRNVFASLNNLLGFVFLTHALLTHHHSSSHWKLSAWFGAALVALSWIAKRQFKEDDSTFSTYLITGLGILTLAVVEKFSGYQTIAALAVEGALLLILGHYLRQPIFRWFGAAAQALCVALIARDCLNETNPGLRGEIATWFAVAVGYCLGFVQHWQTRPEQGPLRESEAERALSGLLQVMANVALALATWEHIHNPWLPMAFAIEAAAVALVGHTIRLPIFRWCSAAFQAISVLLLIGHLLSTGNEPGRELASWLSVAFGYVVVFLQHWYTREDTGELRDNPDERALANLVAVIGNVALLIVTWDFIGPMWRIPTLAIEAAVLLCVGHFFGSAIHRWSGAAFQCLCVALMISRYDKEGEHETQRAIATWFSVVVSYIVALIQHWHTRRDKGKLRDDPGEQYLAWGFAFLANIALLLANWDFVPERWRGTAVALECAAIAGVAGAARAGRLVLSSQMLLLTAYGSFLGGVLNHWTTPAALHLPVAIVVVSLGCAWFTERKLSPENPHLSTIAMVLPIYLIGTVAVVFVSLAQRLDENWHLWTMILTALVTLGIGQFWRNPSWLWLAVVAAAVSAFVFVGHELDKVIDWNQHIVVASHFLALVLLICLERLMKKDWPVEEANEARQPVLTGFIIAIAYLLLHVLWRAASREYLTALWTIGGFGLFGLGLLLKERAYRLAGLSVIGVSVGRAVIYDFWQIQEPLYRILSFIALGVILLVLGYLYAKFREKIMRWL